MADDCTCVLPTLPPDVPSLILLPEDPLCCCDVPEPIVPGIFYDGYAFYNGMITYNSTLA